MSSVPQIKRRLVQRLKVAEDSCDNLATIFKARADAWNDPATTDAQRDLWTQQMLKAMVLVMRTQSDLVRYLRADWIEEAGYLGGE